jgi:hypothetical protein
MQSWLNTFRKPKTSPIGDLARHIVQESLTDAEALKPSIRAANNKDHTQRWLTILCEFLYLFMHLTNRFAYKELGHERRCKVQEQLHPLIVRPTIETIFGHWPTNLKDGMEREFFEKLNTTEIEYGECKQLINRDNPLSQDALFSKFAGNVCELLGVEKADTAAYADVFMKVFDLVIESYDKLNLSETIREVSKEL